MSYDYITIVLEKDWGLVGIVPPDTKITYDDNTNVNKKKPIVNHEVDKNINPLHSIKSNKGSLIGKPYSDKFKNGRPIGGYLTNF